PLALPGTARAIGLMQRSGCLQSPAAVALMACIRQVITEQA
ncbi:LysR family transcriptional regulator, partial [Pseudomonas sp. CM25]|nr:LysR family transcriptional regulator [Pseudomonas sp. CM25]